MNLFISLIELKNIALKHSLKENWSKFKIDKITCSKPWYRTTYYVTKNKHLVYPYTTLPHVRQELLWQNSVWWHMYISIYVYIYIYIYIYICCTKIKQKYINPFEPNVLFRQRQPLKILESQRFSYNSGSLKMEHWAKIG